MAHESDTHADSDPMPRIPHTIKRNGVYYFNFRYPQRLEKAGLTPSHAKKSLRTKDWREAKQRAIREAAIHSAEAERLLTQLEEDESFRHFRQRTEPLVDIATLSEGDQRDQVLKWFVQMETEAEASREVFRESRDEDWKNNVLDTARADLTDYEGAYCYQPSDWEDLFRRFLKERGFLFDAETASADLVRMFRKAVVESQWRTVEEFEGSVFKTRDPLFSGLHADSTAATSEPKGHSVDEICERYPRRKKEGRLSKATLSSYALPIRILKEFFKASTELKAIQFEDGERLVRLLSNVPTNASKRYPGKTIKQAADQEAKCSNPKTISPKRQKDVFIAVKAILNHAVEIGWLERNPFGSRALLDQLPKVVKRAREQFTADELQLLFSSPEFLKWRGKRNRSGQPKEGRFWIPLMGMYLGVRANEAASLLVEDVKEENGVPFIWIREADDAGAILKQLKTAASERRVPIHKELLKIGLLEYAQIRKKEDPKGFLFPEMIPCPQTGNRAKVFSQWFGRLARSTLGDDALVFGKDFHSFRHAITDRLREVTDSDEKRYALLGWVEGAGKRNAGFNYGSGFKMKELKRLIDKVTFPGLDLSHLYSSND
ncbi:MAG: site-specific integrase [Verrucomicrobiales bacterium]|nr:site-specific integrase [Verrucomicrobiales bacterium]